MVSASLVKELRELTGAGMLDCKKALEECNGSIEEATTWLREKGISKAAKKADRIAAEGLADIMIDGNVAAIAEVNSETDFVAKNEEFKSLVNSILTVIVKNGESITSKIFITKSGINEKLAKIEETKPIKLTIVINGSTKIFVGVEYSENVLK